MTLPGASLACGEWRLRLMAALSLAGFWQEVVRQWLAQPTHPTLLALAITETLNLLLLLSNRKPASRDTRPGSAMASLLATFHFLALDLRTRNHWLPETLSMGLILSGFLWQIYAKLSLGRAFGWLPAHRGIVTRGAYRWVRHPIYLGYLLSHCGFLASHATLRNALVYALLYLLQALRMAREERWLSCDPAYRHYRQRVRWRILPGVY